MGKMLMLLRLIGRIHWFRPALKRFLGLFRWYRRQHPWMQALLVNSFILLGLSLLVFVPAALLVGIGRAFGFTKVVIGVIAGLTVLVRFLSWRGIDRWLIRHLARFWSRLFAAEASKQPHRIRRWYYYGLLVYLVLGGLLIELGRNLGFLFIRPYQTAWILWGLVTGFFLFKFLYRNILENSWFRRSADEYYRSMKERRKKINELAERARREHKGKNHGSSGGDNENDGEELIPAEQTILEILRSKDRLRVNTQVWEMVRLSENYPLNALWVAGLSLAIWGMTTVLIRTILLGLGVSIDLLAQALRDLTWVTLTVLIGIGVFKNGYVDVPIAFKATFDFLGGRTPIILREGRNFLWLPRKIGRMELVGITKRSVEEFTLPVTALSVFTSDKVRSFVPVEVQFRIFNVYDAIQVRNIPLALLAFTRSIVRSFVSQYSADENVMNRGFILAALVKAIISTDVEDRWGVYIRGIFIGDVSFSSRIERALERLREEQANVDADTIRQQFNRDQISQWGKKVRGLTPRERLGAVQAELGKAEVKINRIEGLVEPFEALGKLLAEFLQLRITEG